MIAVRKFDLHRIERNRSSLIKDGINYALNDFNINLVVSENGFEATFEKDGGEFKTDNAVEVTKEMKTSIVNKFETEVMSSTW